ncbi:MAG: GNAT family N-acetyltransferase [Verrucomicrobiota bacterium]
MTFRKAVGNDAGVIWQWLTQDSDGYRNHFSGFPDSVEEIKRQLEAVNKDQYWVVESGGAHAGILMARGMDAGFVIPAFGVYIAEAFAGKGLGTRALEYVVQWARDTRKPAIMLTVADENERARHIYEKFGFRFKGERSEKGQRIYRLELK